MDAIDREVLCELVTRGWNEGDDFEASHPGVTIEPLDGRDA